MSELDLIFDEPGPPGGIAGVRLRVLEAMRRLNQALLAGDSATLTLEDWCGGAVAARRTEGVGSPPPPALRGQVLSEAENWYVAERLTPEMRWQRAHTDAAFGRVILPLGPVRQTTAVALLWRPSPDLECLPPGVPIFEHQALVRDQAGRPLAEVIETYCSDALAFRLER